MQQSYTKAFRNNYDQTFLRSIFLDILQPMLSTAKATREAWWWVCLKEDTELYQHADFFLFHEKRKSWTKALSKIKPNHWLVCYQMIISDRSIIFFTSSFPFLIYPPENIVIKVKCFMLKRRENWYRKWEHYEEWKIILITKTSVMKEYFKYVFPRMRTRTEFHIEKGFRTS